jgi:AraC-like DNA-binding protein
MSAERHVLHEITPLGEKDALYIAERHKKEFTYPIHCHEVSELNFIEGASGVVRIVGDSREVVGDYDLVLITSPELEHVWEQGECHSEDIREITVQFDFGMHDDDSFLQKSAFANIREMFKRARRGLAFPMRAIMKVYERLDGLSKQEDHFKAVMTFLTILDDLSRCTEARTLATSSYAQVTMDTDSKQIIKVKNYISNNYMYDLKLEDIASEASMSKSAFSRFFKLHTGRCLTDYITEVRMGNAARLLVDTDETISAISFNVGYNNLSNFNRTFRRLKGCTPTEFREHYRKIKVIV